VWNWLLGQSVHVLALVAVMAEAQGCSVEALQGTDDEPLVFTTTAGQVCSCLNMQVGLLVGGWIVYYGLASLAYLDQGFG
jgi:hypothetical protein